MNHAIKSAHASQAFGSTRPRLVSRSVVAPLLSQRSAIVVRAEPEKSSASQATQAPVKPLEEEVPPWIRREQERKLQETAPKGLPWPLYLLFSCFVAIASVGSVFEYIDKNPVFGVVPVDSPLWAPILLTFAVTGIPMAGFLFLQGVNGFNEEADRQNKMDGYQ